MTPLELSSVLLVMVAALGTLLLPTIVSDTALHDAWISVPLDGLYGLLVLGIISNLARRFPGETLVQYAPRVLGPIGGQIVSFIFVASSLLWLAIIIREFLEFILVSSLPFTPISVLLGIMLSVVVAGARHGFEVIGRLCLLLTPIALIIITVVLGFGTAKMSLTNVEPVLEWGPGLVLRGALAGMGFFGSVSVLAIFLPFATSMQRARKSAAWMLGFTTLILTIATFGTNATFGDITGHLVYPFFSFARVASPGPVAFRADAFIVSLELLGFSTKTIIWAFATSYAVAQWLRLPDYRHLVSPIALTAAALAIGLFASATQVRNFFDYVLPLFSLLFQLGIPAFLWLVSAVRGIRLDTVTERSAHAPEPPER